MKNFKLLIVFILVMIIGFTARAQSCGEAYFEISADLCSPLQMVPMQALLEKNPGMQGGTYAFKFAEESNGLNATTVNVKDSLNATSSLSANFNGVNGHDYYVRVEYLNNSGQLVCVTEQKRIALQSASTTPSLTPTAWTCNGTALNIKLETNGTSWSLLKNDVLQTGVDGLYSFPIGDTTATFKASAANGPCATPVITRNYSNTNLAKFSVGAPAISVTPFCALPTPTQLHAYSTNSLIGTFSWYTSQEQFILTEDLALSVVLPYDANGYQYDAVIQVASGRTCKSPRTTLVPVPVAGVTSAGTVNEYGLWICPGTSPGEIIATASTGGIDIQYQWQYAPGNDTWQDIPGATLASYTPGTLTGLNYFRRKVTACANITSPLYTNVFYVDAREASSHLEVTQQQCPSTLISAQITAGFEKGQGMHGGIYVFKWYAEANDTDTLKTTTIDDPQNTTSFYSDFYTGINGEDYYVSMTMPGGCESARKEIVVSYELILPPLTTQVWTCDNGNTFNIKLGGGTSYALRKTNVVQNGTDGLYTFPMSDRFATFEVMHSNGECSSYWKLLNASQPDTLNIPLPVPAINPFCLDPQPTSLYLHGTNVEQPGWIHALCTWYNASNEILITEDLVIGVHLPYQPLGYKVSLLVRTTKGECTSPVVSTGPMTGHAQPAPAVPATQNITRCDWENLTLTLTDTVASANWYNGNDQLIGSGLSIDLGNNHDVGSHTYKVKSISRFGCVSDTTGLINLTITDDCDDYLNWVKSTGYDETGAVISNSKSFFDHSGQLLQSQTQQFSRETGGKIFATQNLHDKYNRVVGSTLAAPILCDTFKYTHKFFVTNTGQRYTSANFDTPSKTLHPVAVGNRQPVTIGWYYCANNTWEDFVPTTSYPYSRTEFYQDGTGEIKRNAGPGDQHRLGSGHEVLSGTFPVYNELNEYLSMRDIQARLPDNITSLRNSGLQSVARDQNGKYAVSITDKSGKTVMSARPGTGAADDLEVVNTINLSVSQPSRGDHPMAYFYLLDSTAVSIQTVPGDTFVIEDIVSNTIINNHAAGFSGVNGKWPVGFYRIILTDKDSACAISINYRNYYKDISYQFYNDRGALVESLSPNGYKQWKDTVAYAYVDKTTYEYNHQGWLLSMTEPDAGKTSYKYRKDGSIRFSQNAAQYENENATPIVAGKGKFSYTNYDELGRPVESGEYTGVKSFSATASEVEFDSQTTYDSTVKKDWVRTFYDIPDSSFTLAGYTQDYVRGAVSHSQNVNIHTWYSYDEFGRVTWMAQQPTRLPRIFVVSYKYDFLGNVLMVSNLSYDLLGTLQDQFYHHYHYDKDQRLTKAFTSVSENGQQVLRAQYEYYLHGPLKRIVLGDKLQGIDFVYNINGWLTQINHPDNAKDPGLDGTGNGVKKDVFGMVLDYYDTELTHEPLNPLGSIHNLKKRHHLPFESQDHYTANQPLIRFASPAAFIEGATDAAPFKAYGAQNPKYKAMIQGSKDN